MLKLPPVGEGGACEAFEMALGDMPGAGAVTCEPE